MTTSDQEANREALTLVLTASGKTGRRVADLPHDFREYAREVAATGAWYGPEQRT